MQLTQMNAQNIPARSEIGKLIRSCFIAPKGMKMFVSDFSGFELLTMANFSKDPTMCEVLANPKGDLHQTTADMLGVTRQVGKTLNFGLLYGMGPQKLAIQLAMQGVIVSEQEARRYIQNFFKTYVGVDIFRRKIVEVHRKLGYMKNLVGRVRRVENLDASSKKLQAGAEREVVNNIIQGSCADWVKYAMLRIHRDPYMQKAGFVQVLQVHDEIVGFAPDRKFGPYSNSKVLARMQHLMVQPPEHCIIPLPVPVRVAGAFGDNWYAAK